MSLHTYDTLARRVHTEVFRPSPAVWETRCVTLFFGKQTPEGRGLSVHEGVLLKMIWCEEFTLSGRIAVPSVQ